MCMDVILPFFVVVVMLWFCVIQESHGVFHYTDDTPHPTYTSNRFRCVWYCSKLLLRLLLLLLSLTTATQSTLTSSQIYRQALAQLKCNIAFGRIALPFGDIIHARSASNSDARMHNRAPQACMFFLLFPWYQKWKEISLLVLWSMCLLCGLLPLDIIASCKDSCKPKASRLQISLYWIPSIEYIFGTYLKWHIWCDGFNATHTHTRTPGKSCLLESL